MKNTFKKNTLVLALLATPLLVIHQACAMSDEDFVQAVGQEFHRSAVSSMVYGTATVQLGVYQGKPIILHSSGNVDVDHEALRAANKVVDATIGDIQFPITCAVSKNGRQLNALPITDGQNGIRFSGL